jgi:hypothetical protein
MKPLLTRGFRVSRSCSPSRRGAQLGPNLCADACQTGVALVSAAERSLAGSVAAAVGASIARRAQLGPYAAAFSAPGLNASRTATAATTSAATGSSHHSPKARSRRAPLAPRRPSRRRVGSALRGWPGSVRAGGVHFSWAGGVRLWLFVSRCSSLGVRLKRELAAAPLPAALGSAPGLSRKGGPPPRPTPARPPSRTVMRPEAPW